MPWQRWAPVGAQPCLWPELNELKYVNTNMSGSCRSMAFTWKLRQIIVFEHLKRPEWNATKWDSYNHHVKDRKKCACVSVCQHCHSLTSPPRHHCFSMQLRDTRIISFCSRPPALSKSRTRDFEFSVNQTGCCTCSIEPTRSTTSSVATSSSPNISCTTCFLIRSWRSSTDFFDVSSIDEMTVLVFRWTTSSRIPGSCPLINSVSVSSIWRSMAFCTFPISMLVRIWALGRLIRRMAKQNHALNTTHCQWEERCWCVRVCVCVSLSVCLYICVHKRACLAKRQKSYNALKGAQPADAGSKHYKSQKCCVQSSSACLKIVNFFGVKPLIAQQRALPVWRVLVCVCLCLYVNVCVCVCGLISYCWYNPQPMRKDHSIAGTTILRLCPSVFVCALDCSFDINDPARTLFETPRRIILSYSLW